MTTNNLNRDALVVGICQYGDLPMSKELETLATQQAEPLAHELTFHTLQRHNDP